MMASKWLSASSVPVLKWIKRACGGGGGANKDLTMLMSPASPLLSTMSSKPFIESGMRRLQSNFDLAPNLKIVVAHIQKVLDVGNGGTARCHDLKKGIKLMPMEMCSALRSITSMSQIGKSVVVLGRS
jgi:hypothetical protein